MIKKALFLIAIFIVNSICSQTGPGGIGKGDGTSDLFLWLTPENLSAGRIQTWQDQSGYGNDLSQNTFNNRPTVYNNVINGNSAVYFTRSSYTRLVRENFNSFPTTEISGFFTNQSNENGSQYSGLLSYATGFAFGTDDQLLIKDTDDVTIHRKGIEVTDNDNINLGDWNNFGFMWKDNPGTNNDQYALYDEGVISKSGILEQDPISSGGCFAIGGDQINTNVFNLQFYTGYFGEIILFKRALSNVERIIISNYLSAKFGTDMDLGENFYDFDMYKQDDTANGNFDHKVAGIGRDNAGNTHTSSRGAGIVTISNPRDLNDNEYLFWGENQRASAYTYQETNIYSKRLTTKWRVSERKVDVFLGDSPTNIGGVDIELDLTKTSLPSTFCRVRLIVSNDNFNNEFREYNLTVNADNSKATVTNINFEDGDYFTFDYVDEIVLDNTRFYNGSRSNNAPSLDDSCFKLLVKNTATGTNDLQLKESAFVKEVEIETGGNLVVRTGNYLEVVNNINNNGDIRLLGEAQLLQNHTGVKQVTGAGNLYKDQNTSAENNTSGASNYKSLYWSSPVSSNGNTFTISDVLKDGTNPTTENSTPQNITFTDEWDGETTSPITISTRWLAKMINSLDWKREISPTDEVFNPGEAWNMKSTGADNQNFTFVGKPNDGTYEINADEYQYFVLGNPYPSALDADKFLADNSDVLNGTIYYYDSTNDYSHYTSNFAGGYATYTGGVGTPAPTYSEGKEIATKTPGRYLPVGQGFLVYSLENRVNNDSTIEFNNSQRVFATKGNNSELLAKGATVSKNESSGFPILRLGFEFLVEGQGVRKRSVAVGFNKKTHNYENGYDAYMFGIQPTDFGLKCTDTGDSFMSITTIEDFNKGIEIPLLVYLDKERTVTFKIDELENFPETNVYLKDVVTNQYYNISNPNLSVSIDLAQGSYYDRFFIVFKNESSLSVEDFVTSESINAFVDTRTNEIVVYQKNTQVEEVRLFNLLGQEVLKQKNSSGNSQFQIKTKNIKPSVYILSLKTINNKEYTKKVVFNKS